MYRFLGNMIENTTKQSFLSAEYYTWVVLIDTKSSINFRLYENYTRCSKRIFRRESGSGVMSDGRVFWSGHTNLPKPQLFFLKFFIV